MTDFQTKILASGDGAYIHGAFYWNGFCWFSTRETDFHVIKMNVETLDYESQEITNYDQGEDIEVAENYVWVVSRAHNKLIKVNPNDLSDWSVAISFSTLTSAQSLVYYNNFLWVGGTRYIAKVNLTDLSKTIYDYYGTIGTSSFHALTAGDGYIWATTSVGDVVKIDASDGSVTDSFDLAETISDDITYYNGYLYLGTEVTHKTYRFDGSDLSSYISLGESNKVYGVAYSTNNIWTVVATSPGQTLRRTSNLVTKETITFPSGYDEPNEIVFSDSHVFATCWLDPARVVKFPLPVPEDPVTAGSWPFVKGPCLDKAFWGTMRWGYFRWGVYRVDWDRMLEQMKNESAKHLGDCAPAVAGPGGARAAGTLADGSTLHCRANVKIPLFDQLKVRLKK